MAILDEARALLAVMQPLTGERAAGPLTVRATGAPVKIPANVFAVPLVSGVMRHDLIVKTAVNPDDKEGWPVTSAGSAVPVLSNIGGLAMNQAEGARVRWWPTFDGVEAVSLVGAGGLVGGTEAMGFTAVKQMALFEQLRPNLKDGPEDLFKHVFTRYPGVALTWEGSGPGDNQTISPLSQQGARVGRGRIIQQQQWSVYIITSREDANEARREEGLALLDAVADVIGERQFVDGFSFSSPAGAFIKSRSRWIISPSFYVYRIEVSTTGSRILRDPRNFVNPWLVTQLDEQTTDATPLPVVVDAKFPMR